MDEQRQVVLVVSATLLIALSAVVLLGILFLPVFEEETTVGPLMQLIKTPGGDLVVVGATISLLIPFLFVLMYYLHGRETPAGIVPEYLSDIPNLSLTPFQVNLLFKDDPRQSDEFGFYATLLHLQRKKRIEIASRKDRRGVIIRILDGSGDDEYERRVLEFFGLYSHNGIFDSGDLEELLQYAKDDDNFTGGEPAEDLLRAEVIRKFRHNPSRISAKQLFTKVRTDLLHLMRSADPALSQQYFFGGLRLFLIFVIGLMLIGYAADVLITSNETVLLPISVGILLGGLVLIPTVFCLFYFLSFFQKPVQKILLPIEGGLALMVLVFLILVPSIFLMTYVWTLLFGLIILMQATVGSLYSVHLFSRWNKEYYREKLEWDAFARFLANLPQIEQYNHENTELWGEWLVYGTALGVGERVGRAGILMGLDWCYPASLFGEFPWYGHFHRLILPPEQVPEILSR
jgi:hypothetical protein